MVLLAPQLSRTAGVLPQLEHVANRWQQRRVLVNMADPQAALQPLGADIPSECAELANALREVFSGLGLSVRRYAARTHRNPGAVSRYLNGTRVPPWDFVTELLAEITKKMAAPLRPEVIQHVKTAHRHALQISNKKLHEVQVLQDRLEDADLLVQQAAVRERVLMEGLQAREDRIARLEYRHAALLANWGAENSEKGTREVEQSSDSDIRELANLKKEVEELKSQLEEAKEASAQAEAKCATLEERLAEAEERAQAGQEARDANALQEARQSLAEAHAAAAALQAQLDEISARQVEQHRAAAARAERDRVDAQRRVREAKEKDFEEQRERRRWLQEATPGELAHRIMTFEMKGPIAGLDLQNSISDKSPVDKVFETVLILKERGHVSPSTMMYKEFMRVREPEEVIAFIKRMEESTELSQYVGIALDSYSWNRGYEEISLLMRTFRQQGREDFVSRLVHECGRALEASTLADLILNDTDMRSELMESVIAARTPVKLAPLFLQLHQKGMGDFADEIAAALKTASLEEYKIFEEFLKIAAELDV